MNSTSKGQATNKYMFVNTNSFMGSTDGGEGGDANAISAAQNFIAESMQRAVVGAWLLVKEATALLANLVISRANAMACSPGGVNTDELEPHQCITFRDINLLGGSLLDGLGRLKHMGAISESHAALQLLCEGLLRIGGKNPDLCRLPMQWLKTGLVKLESQKQMFILRRSAGFYFSRSLTFLSYTLL